MGASAGPGRSLLAVLLVVSAALPARGEEGLRLEGARLAERVVLPWLGDLWPATRSADGIVYLAFGDGSGMARCLPVEGLDWPREGPGQRLTVEEVYGERNGDFCGVFPCGPDARYPLCPYTRAGIVRVRGQPPRFEPCRGPDQCVVARHLPTGREDTAGDVKPSSLLALGGRLYAHLHRPSARPTRGSLAVSTDGGRTWTEIPGSPWGPGSHFRVAMFLQQGRGHRSAPDGHVYAFGIGNEIDIEDPRLQPVYLARVPADRIESWAAWRYLAGIGDDGRPRWSARERDARPLPGLQSIVQGGGMLHRPSGRYLFYSGFVGLRPARLFEPGAPEGALREAGALFEAPAPWGPWREAAVVPGGQIGAFLPAAGALGHVWVTGAGNTLPYSLHLMRLELRWAGTRSRSQRADPGRKIWAFYYPWYRRGDWKEIPGRDAPLEPYDSDDPRALARHIRQARKAGIDGFIVSWSGPDDPSDRVLARMLEEARRQSFAITIYLETLGETAPHPPRVLERWLRYLLTTRARHPAWERVGGRPLVVIYAAEATPLEDWKRVLERLRRDGLDPYTLATGEDPQALRVFDGLHNYEAFSVPDLEEDYRAFAAVLRRTAARLGGSRPVVWMPAVQPGYDERGIPGREGLSRSRDEGRLYRRTFEAAIASRPDWIVITSWNEWPERTYIEPSRRYGDLYLRLTREYAERFRSGTGGAAP